MKRSKPVLTILACFCMSAVFAAAEPLVSITDADSNKISVSGPAQSEASLLIINPSFTETDAQNGTEGAIQFFRRQTVTDGYYFDVDINVTSGGRYTVIVNADGVTDKTTFMFYSAEERLGIIERLNASASCADILEEAMEKFSLSEQALYKNGSKDNIIKAVNAAKLSCTNGKFPNDLNETYTILRKALLCAAYNSSDSALTMSGDTLLYSDLLELETTAEYDDYINALSADGRKAMNTKLLSGSYSTLDDVSKAFKEAVPFYVIVSYNKSGFGHVEGYLNKYSSYYTAHGFSLSKLSGITNKNSFYSALAASKASDITALATEFNAYKESDAGTGNGGGGSGGSSSGSVSSNPGSGAGYISNEPTLPFDDIDNVQWAHSAILYLAEKGIIAGRGNRAFSPMDTVTRAEFVRMVVAAYGFTADDDGKRFSDVGDTAWYAEAIRIAAACGIVSGVSEDRFAPDELVTREQGAVIIANAMKYAGDELSEGEKTLFSDDENISGWAKENVYLLQENGIVSGREGNLFAPKDSMTRAEAARMIYGLFADAAEQGESE